jgi:aminoglycoside phosphotransferase family enzyme/predicted kinase
VTLFDRIVAGLRRPDAYPHRADRLAHIETHISHVFLAGDYAYKVKKPLNLGFLDFSTLERRRLCCGEEIRLNSRLAPRIYLEVVPIAGTPDAPRIGGEGTALEYAVRMRRFDQESLLTRLPVTPELADRIAERVAQFHDAIPAAPQDSPFGTPEAVLGPMDENFSQIRARLPDPSLLSRLDPLEAWTHARHSDLRPLLEDRRRDGHIRECHGDMHRGNIALVQGDLVIFDGIEFNPGLRWIDTMSELAFLVMDLEEAGELPQARRLLNRYLEIRGDYGGLPLLDFYKVYRAMVRAKVTAIRLGQSDVGPAEAAEDREELERYLALAEGYTRPGPRRLYLTCGVSGSGKSRLSAILREHVPLVHIRSDVERKRLFGLPADARTGSDTDAGIYTKEASARTYGRLRELASVILDAGYSPLVDATFLERSRRRDFIALADEKGCPCTILVPEAPDAVLRERVAEREAEGRDPSEAGLAVLEAQLARREPLTEEERGMAVLLDTVHPPSLEDFLDRLPG